MLDQDTQDVVTALELACRRAGLSSAAFARALGTSPSRFSTYRSGKVSPSAALLMRATRISHGLATARERELPTSLSAALDIERSMAADFPAAGVTRVLDVVEQVAAVLRHHAPAAAAWEAAASTGSHEWDVFLAAAVAHAFAADHRAAPRWTALPPLDQDWFPWIPLRMSEDQVRADTPDWLAAHRIFVAPSALDAG